MVWRWGTYDVQLLLVPYFSWQRSHAVHHNRTNHITEGETHVPDKASEPAAEATLQARMSMGDGPFAILHTAVVLLFGWPVYLLTGASGGPVRGKVRESVYASAYATRHIDLEAPGRREESGAVRMSTSLRFFMKDRTKAVVGTGQGPRVGHGVQITLRRTHGLRCIKRLRRRHGAGRPFGDVGRRTTFGRGRGRRASTRCSRVDGRTRCWAPMWASWRCWGFWATGRTRWALCGLCWRCTVLRTWCVPPLHLQPDHQTRLFFTRPLPLPHLHLNHTPALTRKHPPSGSGSST